MTGAAFKPESSSDSLLLCRSPSAVRSLGADLVQSFWVSSRNKTDAAVILRADTYRRRFSRIASTATGMPLKGFSVNSADELKPVRVATVKQAGVVSAGGSGTGFGEARAPEAAAGASADRIPSARGSRGDSLRNIVQADQMTGLSGSTALIGVASGRTRGGEARPSRGENSSRAISLAASDGSARDNALYEQDAAEADLSTETEALPERIAAVGVWNAVPNLAAGSAALPAAPLPTAGSGRPLQGAMRQSIRAAAAFGLMPARLAAASRKSVRWVAKSAPGAATVLDPPGQAEGMQGPDAEAPLRAQSSAIGAESSLEGAAGSSAAAASTGPALRRRATLKQELPAGAASQGKEDPASAATEQGAQPAAAPDLRFFFGSLPDDECVCAGVPLAPCSLEESACCASASVAACGEDLSCVPGLRTFPDALSFMYGEMTFREALWACTAPAWIFLAMFCLPALNFMTIPLWYRLSGRIAHTTAVRAKAAAAAAAASAAQEAQIAAHAKSPPVGAPSSDAAFPTPAGPEPVTSPPPELRSPRSSDSSEGSILGCSIPAEASVALAAPHRAAVIVPVDDAFEAASSRSSAEAWAAAIPIEGAAARHKPSTPPQSTREGARRVHLPSAPSLGSSASASGSEGQREQRGRAAATAAVIAAAAEESAAALANDSGATRRQQLMEIIAASELGAPVAPCDDDASVGVGRASRPSTAGSRLEQLAAFVAAAVLPGSLAGGPPSPQPPRNTTGRRDSDHFAGAAQVLPGPLSPSRLPSASDAAGGAGDASPRFEEGSRRKIAFGSPRTSPRASPRTSLTFGGSRECPPDFTDLEQLGEDRRVAMQKEEEERGGGAAAATLPSGAWPSPRAAASATAQAFATAAAALPPRPPRKKYAAPRPESARPLTLSPPAGVTVEKEGDRHPGQQVQRAWSAAPSGRPATSAAPARPPLAVCPPSTGGGVTESGPDDSE